MAIKLGGLGQLGGPGTIKLVALALVGFIVVTGRQVDPLILAALLSPLVLTDAEPPPEAKPTEPTREETSDA